VTPAAAADAAAFPQVGYLSQPHLAARAKPSLQAPVAEVLEQFRSDHRPTIVHAVASLTVGAGTASKQVWYKISLPGRPNGRYGWVRAAFLEDLAPRLQLIRIDLSERTLSLYQQGDLQFRTRIAVGARGMETPTGRFYLAAGFRPKSYLGPWAFETSAYSKLSEWPGGGIIGIHGWNDPSVMGQAVSHGCIRLTNWAILSLKKLAPLGTTLEIVA
jgi:hypothetical protein